MQDIDTVQLANAEGHTILAMIWGLQAAMCCMVFLCYLWRERPWAAIYLRFQLAFALAAVCFSDAWSGAIGTLFWFHVDADKMVLQQYMLFALIPLRAIAAMGFLIAVRAVSFQKYGNKLWLIILLSTALLSWLMIHMLLQ